MSKESKIKKRQKKVAQQAPPKPATPPVKRNLTAEERALIIRNRLANRPVISFRYPNGKLNKRFVITLGLFAAALIAALYFSTRL